MRQGPPVRLVLLLAFGIGCVGTGVPPAGVPEPDSDVEPRHGLFDQAAERGLDLDQTGHRFQSRLSHGGVVATDLDDDGDIDLLLGQRSPLAPFMTLPRLPVVLANDGRGHFEVVDLGTYAGDLTVQDSVGFAAVDTTGDRLPELYLFGRGFVAELLNLGGLSFAEPTFLEEPDPAALVVINTLSFGDLDGDGDLDLVAPTLGLFTGADAQPQGEQLPGLPERVPHRLFLHGPDGWTRDREFETPAYSQMAIVTDRDGDGDQDLFLVSEFASHPEATASAFYRNDGGPVSELVDDAVATGTDLMVGGMGIDSADLNQDGRLDYCVAQFGPPTCLASYSDGSWVEAARAWNLVVTTDTGPAPAPPEWSAYSLELADLDNDGWLDAAIVAGNPAPDDDSGAHIDRLWMGGPGPWFEDITEEVGFGDPTRHFGMAAADFDGNGRLDLIVTGVEGPPRLWMNFGPASNWLEIELEGVPGNAEGHGAQVAVEAGGARQIREQLNLRSLGQGPARLHFGLGEATTVDAVEVLWPDGVRAVYDPPPVGGVARLRHPGAG